MLWSIVSNPFCKSLRTIPVRRPESKPFVISLWRYVKQESVSKIFRNLLEICIGHCYLIESSKFDYE